MVAAANEYLDIILASAFIGNKYFKHMLQILVLLFLLPCKTCDDIITYWDLEPKLFQKKKKGSCVGCFFCLEYIIAVVNLKLSILQIITFLQQNAHPRVAERIPSVPENVTDQVDIVFNVLMHFRSQKFFCPYQIKNNTQLFIICLTML